MTSLAAYFTGGGSLDGAVLELPAHVTGVVTTDRDGRSYYALEDQADAFAFVGFDTTGETMGKIARAFSAEAKAERESVEAAMKPVGCRSCGRTYGSQSAYIVHFELGEGSRCLSDDARGQLVEISGVWCLPGTDVARR